MNLFLIFFGKFESKYYQLDYSYYTYIKKNTHTHFDNMYLVKICFFKPFTLYDNIY